MYNVLNFFALLNRSTPKNMTLYNRLVEETKDNDGFFYLSIEEYSDKISCSPRQLRRHLKELSDGYLIEKDYRSHETGSRLYVKVNELLDDKNMTFTATYDETEVIGKSKVVRIKNIYNRNYTVTLNKFWIYYNKDNESFLGSLYHDECFFFEAEVVAKEIKFDRWNLKNIRNLRK